MCLGLACEVLDVTADSTARVVSEGRTLAVSLLTLDGPVAPGDWLLVHSGFALARLTREQALDALAVRSTRTEGSS